MSFARRHWFKLLIAFLAVIALDRVAPDMAAKVSILVTLAVFGAMLTLIIGWHELAHLLTARALGIRVETYALGFGPRLIGRSWRGITWQLNAIPAGGYVKLHGERTDEDGPGSFFAAPLPKRLAVIVAGPLSNVLLAWLISVVVQIAVLGRDLGTVLVNASLSLVEITGIWLSAMAALPGQLFADPSAAPVTGIPGMAAATGDALAASPLHLVGLVAMLSLMVGLMNLLPIAPLDGGAALLNVLRSTLGRFYTPKLEIGIQLAGLAIILALFVFATSLDLLRLAGQV